MQAAAKFLNRIGPEELERCLFTETLALVAAGGQPQGHLWVTARHAPYEQEGQLVRSCLLLQAGSQGLLDGVPYSCRLTGYVSMQLETLEQEQHERLEFGAHPMERKIHMVQHPHGMTVTVTTQDGEADPQHQVFSYSWASLEGLLGEAASLLLLRVLACRRAVPPSITFPAIDKEGHLCTTTYVRPWGARVADTRMTGGHRVILCPYSAPWACGSSRWAQHRRKYWWWREPCMLPRAFRWCGTTASSPAGIWLGRCRWGARWLLCCRMHLLSAAWVQSPSLSSQSSCWTGRRTPSCAPGSWTGRQGKTQAPHQLGTGTTLSSTLQEELRASHSTYIQQHPELFALLADFLQALLLRQPPDPILFAAEFFAPFARHQPPGPSFASSVSPSPFCSISCPSPLAQGD
ncbi:ciliogenesis-associated TTC17-interacting protein isoform X1 [Lagopus muta]|uniref:ciliogenesis-associated TTC17-interacting protein isoform X1 n=1 Tax=Lagopus muta TaxID=64668 RepID=UPI00209CE108|nr:ciliogenesis-associated TTC17-interacting protein isoform X1 [Lagopus muta]